MHVCPRMTQAIDIALSPCTVLIVSLPTLRSQIIFILAGTEKESRSSSKVSAKISCITTNILKKELIQGLLCSYIILNLNQKENNFIIINSHSILSALVLW